MGMGIPMGIPLPDSALEPSQGIWNRKSPNRVQGAVRSAQKLKKKIVN